MIKRSVRLVCAALVATSGVFATGTTSPVSAQVERDVTGDAVAAASTLPLGGAYGEFTPVDPDRIVDTRVGIGGRSEPLGAGGAFDVQVLGEGGIPSEDVIAVVLNVTAVNPSSSGYVTVWPAGIDQPTISNINFAARRTVPNLVTVAVGVDGQVSIANEFGSVHVVVDVAGYYSDEDGTVGGHYNPLEPTRITDTRSDIGLRSGPLGAGQTMPVQVVGDGLAPGSATAVVLNVTAVNGSSGSFFTVYPDGDSRPVASNVNFAARTAVANQVIIEVPSNGIVNVFNAAGEAHVLVDLMGYYRLDPGSERGRFVPFRPFRVADTRIESPFPAPGKMPANSLLAFVAIEDPETALVGNVTVTATVGDGYITAYAFPGDLPATSTVNYRSGQTVANHAIIPVDPTSAFDNAGGVTHLIVDLFGYFS